MWGALSDETVSLSLKFLPVLINAAILGSKSHGTHYHILLSQIRDSPTLEGQVPVFMPKNGVAQLYPQHWVPYSSPQMIQRGIVEVSEPTSTEGLPYKISKLQLITLAEVTSIPPQVIMA
jgi:hypothetical protein